jgi:hypothetical protein
MNKVKKTCTQFTTKILSLIFPSFAVFFAKKILFTPKKKSVKWPIYVKQFSHNTKQGEINYYKYGEGKCIWLIHGWSGSAYDFWPLMQKLAGKGFSTVAFDLPAHGNSSSKAGYCSLPQMIKSFDDFSTTIFQPSLVVTHGMGASVVANSQWIKSYQQDLLLVSPVLNTYEFLQGLVQKSGFNQELFEKTIQEIFKREKVLLSWLSALPALKNLQGELKIIHDVHDEQAPLEISEQLTNSVEATLIKTNQLGHNKILRSRRVLNAVESY